MRVRRPVSGGALGGLARSLKLERLAVAALAFGSLDCIGRSALRSSPTRCSTEVGCPDGTECSPTGTCLVASGGLCVSDDACSSGFCAGGTCCSTACFGPCIACRSDGLCNIAPADDAACGVIDCDELDSPCRDHHDLQAQRCAAFGQCLPANGSACTAYSNAAPTVICRPAAVLCDLEEFCDGDGTCPADVTNGIPDRDRDGYGDRACGGADCDDGNDLAHPGQSEGPAGVATCTDGFDNDCDDFVDIEDTACLLPYTTARYVAVSDVGHTTANTSFEDVPGGSLSFTPSSSSEVWLLLFSAALSSTSIANGATEVRYLVNGVEHGGGSEDEDVPDQPLPWMHFYRVAGTAVEQVVQVQLRAAAGTATVSRLSIVALAVPSGADLQYVEADAEQAAPHLTWTTNANLAFTPIADGNYLLLALANINEAPASNDIHARVEYPAGTYWSAQSYHRSAWAAAVWIRELPLSAQPVSVALQSMSDNVAGGSIRYARVLAMRADAFEAVDTVLAPGPQTILSTTPVTMATLTTRDLGLTRDYIALQCVAHKALDDDDLLTRGWEVRFLRDSVVQDAFTRYDKSAGPQRSACSFHAVTTATSMSLDNQLFITGAILGLEATDATISVWRLPPL